jgi:DNA-binding transcriptional LysR family regulator
MELRHLRYFVTVADALHFGRAAAQLHIVQPALSQQIKQLERELGVSLLTRTRRHVQLTEPGRLFLRDARRILAESESAMRTAQRAAVGDVGRLAVGFSEIAMWTVFPKILRTYRDRYPEVEITFNERPVLRLMEGLTHGQFDICCIPLPLFGSGFRWKVIAHTHLVAALPKGHRLATRRRVPLAALAQEQFVSFPLSWTARLVEDSLLARGSDDALVPRIVQEAEPLHTILALVGAGLGVTLAPAWVEDFRRDAVEYRRLIPAGPHVRLAVVWRGATLSPTVTRFLMLLDTMVSRVASPPAFQPRRKH